MNTIQIFALVISGLLFIIIFQLIRKKKLKEQYSLLWFLTAAVMFVLALWEPLLARISSLLGIAIPSNALFLLALLFLFGMALHFSMLISRLTDQSKMLAQKLTLLERDLRLEREGKELDDAEGADEAEQNA